MDSSARIGGIINHRGIGAAFLLAYFNIVPGWISDFFGNSINFYKSTTFSLIILTLLIAIEVLDLTYELWLDSNSK